MFKDATSTNIVQAQREKKAAERRVRAAVRDGVATRDLDPQKIEFPSYVDDLIEVTITPKVDNALAEQINRRNDAVSDITTVHNVRECILGQIDFMVGMYNPSRKAYYAEAQHIAPIAFLFAYASSYELTNDGVLWMCRQSKNPRQTPKRTREVATHFRGSELMMAINHYITTLFSKTQSKSLPQALERVFSQFPSAEWRDCIDPSEGRLAYTKAFLRFCENTIAIPSFVKMIIGMLADAKVIAARLPNDQKNAILEIDALVTPFVYPEKGPYKKLRHVPRDVIWAFKEIFYSLRHTAKRTDTALTEVKQIIIDLEHRKEKRRLKRANKAAERARLIRGTEDAEGVATTGDS